MKRMKWQKIGRAGVCFCFFVFVMSLAGCSNKIVFTKGLSKDEVFRIGDSVCTVPEMMVYLINTRNQYEKVYGAEVWDISVDGVTLEENVKETVLARIARIKTMYLLAASRGVTLEDGEERRVKKAAEEYFASLSEEEKELMGADEDVIEQLYREYALADKVYQNIIKDVNPEISDDEARTITVQHILLSTSAEEGGRKYSEEEKQAVYSRACEIRRMAVDGEHDFVDLASRYSEDSVTTFSFGKGDREEAFEEAAFALETGEVSQVIETEEGYHIIKCVSTFDRSQTDANKLEILEERRREVFGQEYDAFVETLARQLNKELWEELAMPRNEKVATAGFFDIYRKYFPDSGKAY